MSKSFTSKFYLNHKVFGIIYIMIIGLSSYGCSWLGGNQYKAGHCFSHRNEDTISRITYVADTISARIVHYTWVSSKGIGQNERDDNDAVTWSNTFNGFRHMYPDQVDCSQYNDLKQEYRLGLIEERLKSLEGK